MIVFQLILHVSKSGIIHQLCNAKSLNRFCIIYIIGRLIIMPTELNTFNFTNRSDLAQDLNDGLANTGNFVNTLPGNDTLEGAGGNFGLNNSGTIETGNGDDTIEASGGSGGSGLAS